MFSLLLTDKPKLCNVDKWLHSDAGQVHGAYATGTLSIKIKFMEWSCHQLCCSPT